MRPGLLRGRDPKRSKARIGWHGGPAVVCNQDWPSGRGLEAGIGPCTGTQEN